MASRYLRASGNWNGPVWADSQFGVAGSAATPTASDVVYIFDGSTLTLNSDIQVQILQINWGTLDAQSYDVTLTSGSGFAAKSNSAKTIKMGSGTWTVNASGLGGFVVEGTNTTLDKGTAKLILNAPYINSFKAGVFNIGNRSINDVEINIGSSSYSSPNTVNIIGSPTFRSLTIQSKNSAAHTVNFDNDIDVTKFIAIGPSTSNRLKLIDDSFTGRIRFASNGTSYGQFVDASNMLAPYDSNNTALFDRAYLGTNSTGSGVGWLLQNPPKISTLVDEFTSLSSARWETQAVGSGYVNASGGTLNMGWLGGSAYTRITTKDTYDLVGETIYMKVVSSTGGLFMSILPVALQGQSSSSISTQILSSGERYWRFTSTASGENASVTAAWFDNGTWVQTFTQTVPAVQVRSVRFQIDGTRNANSAELVVESVGVGPFPTQPETDFVATPRTGLRPQSVSFTDLTKGIPDTWNWNFGDGYSSTQQNPVHPYSRAGTYTVSLTASNEVGTDTETKNGYIVIDPVILSRSISGGLIFGGGASRRLLASRSISGTLLFGGGVRAVVLRDVEGLQDKRYLYKVYDPDGNYVEVWKDVISELNFTHEINTIGSTTTVELARNSDTLGTTTAPLLTEDGQNLLTEDDFDILVSTQSRNQVGSGSSVDYNNRVDITVFYGSVEPLLTENDEPLLTEDDEELLADVGAPNGRRIFTGFISEINSRYGNTETTIVQLTSYGWDLDQFPITTSGGATTVPFNSYDPSNIASEAIDKFITDSTSYGTYTTRTDSSISPTGTTVSYTFRANTYGDVLDKTLELMPSNWYYRVGLGDNTVYYRERSATPHHLFYLGKHIKAMDLKGSIMESTNRVLFTGGGDPALFINREEVPADRTRRRLEIISDSRVTLTDSAEIISDGRIEQHNKQLFRTTVEILAVQYDIESIDVGQTVGFRNFGDQYVDGLLLQIVGLSYSPDSVQLQLETKPPTINKRLQDIQRNLTVTENQNVPDAPS